MKKSIYNIGFGIVLGIILAMVVLTMSEAFVFQLWSISFWFEVIIMCMLPLCIKVIRKYKYNDTMISIVMVGISFLLVVIYGLFVMRSASNSYWILMGILHGACLISSVIVRLVQ